MNRFCRSSVAIATSAICLASVAHAEPTLGGTFCFPGAFQACASVSVHSVEFNSSTPWADGETTIVIRVMNLEGQPGIPSSGPYGIFMLGLSNTTSNCPVNGLPGGVCQSNRTSVELGPGASDVVAGATTCVGPGCLPGHWDSADGNITVYAQGGWYGTVLGCTLPPRGSYIEPDGFSTCGGYLDIAVSMIGDWGLTDLSQLTVGGVGEYPGNPSLGTTFHCTIGVSCITVTPEPATIVLLGTGLTGVFGARIRRRKKTATVDG
jgi:hypothetical protein